MIFQPEPDDSLYVSRLDASELLGTVSDHSFQLEDRIWPTVEHYIQAMQFSDEARQENIRLAKDHMVARKLGKTGLFRRARADWSDLRRVYMTRGVYTKARSYSDVADALLETGSIRIIENDQYDYYWGCGRDRRGDNTYGKILMEVRQKLRDEVAAR